MKIRVLVTGIHGQLARSIVERSISHPEIEILTLGRPTLDLALPETLTAPLAAVEPDLLVSAAAYTAVDLAESEKETAYAINAQSIKQLGAFAESRSIPIIHISTDYVFDGEQIDPYREDDAPAPINAYGCSKLAGEKALAEETENYVILRTAWLYSPFGRNFAKSMLDIAHRQNAVSVVDDQTGSPTSALDVASAILTIAKNMLHDTAPSKRGLFHLTARGSATWADYAETLFDAARLHGEPACDVRRIASVDYPTAARRPRNSTLNCDKIARAHGVVLPEWTKSVRSAATRLLRNNQGSFAARVSR